MRTSFPFALRIRGPLACFTRPELKVDRVTYDVITPSAARAIFESVFWKPEIAWSVRRIELLSPPAHQVVTINEVKSKASGEAVSRILAGGEAKVGVDPSAERTQRTSTLLRDVDYIVHACFSLRNDLPDCQMHKYVDIFRRRAKRGQSFYPPYLGMKEFPATLTLVEDRAQEPSAIAMTADMGIMLYDLWSGPGGVPSPSYFHARMEGGVIDVPAPGSRGIMQ